jgi:CxxC-x17-CxxC domain-containing protein
MANTLTNIKRGGHPMFFQEKTLRCSACGNTFKFHVDELEYFLRGHISEPERCPDCLQTENLSLSENSGYLYIAVHQTYHALCADCGKETEVPFISRQDNPANCNDCYRKEKLNV